MDIWAAGCVLYTMLCGYQPFHAKYSKDLIQKIKEEAPNLDSDFWQRVSPQAKHLVKLLLEKDPQKRPNIVKVLRHSWFSNECQKYGFNDSSHLNFKMNLLRNQRKLSRNSKGDNWEQTEEMTAQNSFTFTTEKDLAGSDKEEGFYFSM